MSAPRQWGLAALVFGLFIHGVAAFADASAWNRDRHAAIRLLAGSRAAGGALLIGGIEIELQPGWKTYWRTPGDSGVPPRFDFSGSDNIETVTVLWPAPEKFPDGNGGFSFGYHERVVLPLRIVAKDAGKPVTLRAAIQYAVCEKLCIPLETSAKIQFSEAVSTQDGMLKSALERLPQPARIGEAGPLAVRDIRLGQAAPGGKPRLLIDIAAPPRTAVELFAEGPTDKWTLPAPVLVARAADGTQHFTLDLGGAPAGAALRETTLRLTLVGADNAYEIAVPLAAALPLADKGQ
ncbi:MAG: cytochrome C biogenesis protein [Xanthobacteraceae bacterium]|nr:MAG: cytochrome C biogenesis protein [Xanthobacteraceae bacterium]